MEPVQLDALNKQHDALLAATHSTVSADTIADVNLDADELDSIQKSKLQQFFGIADSEVSVRFVRRSHFLVFNLLFGPVSLHKWQHFHSFMSCHFIDSICSYTRATLRVRALSSTFTSTAS